mmetsp:Transcript_12375/g.22431  ORF Transcript_12375/g.22431 Transcript_12375/m.22431 type:complete len:417 (+) Transcript_12375:1634-2884(+)
MNVAPMKVESVSLNKPKKLWRPRYLKRPKAYRSYIIRNPWELPMIAIHLSTIQIQRMFRGYLHRKLYSSGRISKSRANTPKRNRQVYSLKRTSSTFFESCHRFSLYQVAAVQIQSHFRQYLLNTRTSDGLVHLEYNDAACRIQRAWCRYVDRYLFLQRLDLLRFRNEGDPAQLLRSINPAETHLFDKATKISLRFRFGGTCFPPNIYYKIFTYSSLCDVGAFAPRDYTYVKQPNAATVNLHDIPDEYSYGSIRVGNSEFNTTLSQSTEADLARNGTDGWYHRYENNGWRPVAAKTLKEADLDPVTQRTKYMAKRYHYSKVKRKEDKVLKNKQKKREWYKKIYLEGKSSERVAAALESKVDLERKPPFFDDQETKVDSYYNEVKTPEDDDELLEWSAGLDFDDYVKDWHTIGTSFQT